jgi:hypothetical protein
MAQRRDKLDTKVPLFERPLNNPMFQLSQEDQGNPKRLKNGMLYSIRLLFGPAAMATSVLHRRWGSLIYWQLGELYGS